MGKTVLILGNGFDLAHGLPTRYSDFLDFCEIIMMIKSNPFLCINNKNVVNTVNNSLNNFYKTEYNDENIFQNCQLKYSTISEIFDCLNFNIWYSYLTNLYKENKLKGENWIDFESEIRFIIQSIDKITYNLLTEFNLILDKINYDDELLMYKINKFKKCLSAFNDIKYVKDLRDVLYTDMEDLTRVLELYLSNVIEAFPISVYSSEIKKIVPDFIMNFNYTNTYTRTYNKLRKVFHIHGRCKRNGSSEKNNMVLGIDEYWTSKEDQDTHTNFTIFKKFAQRIRKRTGVRNYSCIRNIENEFNKHKTLSYVYIFGHSLDVTDKDILFDFLNSEATSVTIFCKDKSTEGELIANVIKIIGEERLLKKANQSPIKFNFVIPKDNDMIPIENFEKELLLL